MNRSLPPLIVLSLFLATAAEGGRVHPGPSIWGGITFGDGEMKFVFEGAADPLATNLGLDTLLIGPLPEETVSEITTQVFDWFKEKNAISINGERVLPVKNDVIIQDGLADEASWKSCRFTLTYPCPEPPTRLTIHWDSFAGEGVDFVPVTLTGPDVPPIAFSMFPDEPEYTWHADSVKRERAAEFQRVVSDSGGIVRVSMASIGLALVASILTLVIGRAVGHRAALATCGVALLGVFMLRDVAVTEVKVPWKTRVYLPSPDQALTLFKGLHSNIYAAFAANDEDSIYELLATCVDVKILDDLYADVYESLILREQGGAVCGIEGVDVISGDVDRETYAKGDEPEFQVDWKWQVHGIVSHYGHIHRRMNEYEAKYTVRHDGESWKIAGVDVTSHTRREDFQ